MDIRFNGKPIPMREGDTVASALYRAGQRIFTRSFKYHRPRGLLCCSGHCPNCLMNVDGIPNVRTCITPARDGMTVRHQNAKPSLDFDYLSIAQRFDWMMPVGWYYKRFTNPRLWHLAEAQIRKVAGLGDPPPPDTAGSGLRTLSHAGGCRCDRWRRGRNERRVRSGVGRRTRGGGG